MPLSFVVQIELLPGLMERTDGIEPSSPTLEGRALPLSYIRSPTLLAKNDLAQKEKPALGFTSRPAMGDFQLRSLTHPTGSCF
jgi:hypothetical protein